MVGARGPHIPLGDEIVITGISGRFPFADNIDEFRDKLFNKEDLIRPKEEPNWKNGKLGVPNFVGQINKKNKFDAGFFGVNPKHCASTDPFVRILLEKVFEAIVDAGFNPSELKGTNTAVFTGSNISESENTYIYIPVKNNLAVMGHSRAMVSNRISYWLNVTGTSISMVSTETCGFEALTAAYNEMKTGRSDAAVVGAVNLVMHPELSYHYNALGVLSQDGKTRAFDADADGYARSEGVVALFLQRARDARRIYATVVNSDFTTHGDREVSYTVPYGPPLGDLMERFYRSCGVDPEDLDFLEADGLATKLGDEEEMKMVDKVLLRNRKKPLLVGSVKSNMGHGNAAATLCSIAKVLIAMQTGAIPPNLHFKKPSPKIPALVENRAQVVTETTPWNGGLVALNSVGITGSYAHVLLRSYARDKSENPHSDGLPRLIITSSRTMDGVQNMLKKIESQPVDVEYVHLLHRVHSVNINNHLYRGYTIVPPLESPVHEFQHYDQSDRQVWFIFSGMGSQWPGMGRELMKLPVCAMTINKCHAILAAKGLNLKHIITTDDSTVFENILHSFVGIAAIQIALVDLLTAIGIRPDAMLGHSVGELGCAYADGCLTLEQVILSAYYRGQASLQAKLIKGSMAAVGLGYKQVKHMLPAELDVACHNSSDSCTLSGPAEDVVQFVEILKSKKIFARAVNVSNIAYHSRYIKPAAPFLLESLQKLITEPKTRSSKWICSSIPEERWDTPLAHYCSAEYLTNNLLSSVLFEEASSHIPKNAIAIEIAPHGLLQAILRRSLGSECTNISLTQRGHPHGLHFLFTAIGKLYLAGLMPDVKELYPPVQLPVSRGTPSLSPLISWDHTDTWYTVGEVDKSELMSGEREVLVNLNQEEFRDYAGHVVNGNILFPAFAYLKIIWETLATLKETTLYKLPIVFEDVKFFQEIQIEERGSQTLFVLVQRGSGEFEISNEKDLLVKGRATVPENVEDCYVQQPAVPEAEFVLSGDDMYMEMAQRGYEYKGFFRGVKQIRIGSEGCVASVEWNQNWVASAELMLQLIMFQNTENNQVPQVPSSLQKIVFNPLKHGSDTQDLQAVYHKATGIVRCGGLELRNFKTVPSVSLTNQEPTLSVDAVRFINQDKPDLQSEEQFIALTLQWAVENNNSSNISILMPNNSEILKCIKHFMTKVPQVNVSTKMDPGKLYNFVISTRKEETDVFARHVSHRGGFLLLITENNGHQLRVNFKSVMHQTFRNKTIHLLRKTEKQNGYVSQVLPLKGNISEWLQQIWGTGPCYRLYAVAVLRSQAMETIMTLIEHTHNISGLEHVRFVFILDKTAPQFSLTEETYKKQLILDLKLNVLCNGQWGSFSHVPLNTSNSISQDLASLPSLRGIDVNFFGLTPEPVFNSSSEISIMTRDSSLLDFSGFSHTGQRLMGVALLDHKTRKLVTEQYLIWKNPSSWSLQEAATMPLAYAMAYYSLILTAKLKKGESVLVHAGWSSIGQAAIALALDHGCTVFTSVSNNEQKIFLLNRFPQLKEEHCCNCSDVNFEVDVLRCTRGQGVHVVLNCLTGSSLQASVRCLAAYGRFLQLVPPERLSKEDIGMLMFLKSASMVGISLDSLFTLPLEWRNALHSGIEEKIKSGVIKPVPSTVFSGHQAHKAFSAVRDVQNTSKVLVMLKSNCVNKKQENTENESYTEGFSLVVGGEVEQCMDMAEWLAQQGVRQVALAVRSKCLAKHIEHKMRLLNTCHRTKVIPLMTNVSCGSQLLREASSIFPGPLKGIFILPLEPGGQENCLTASVLGSLDAAARNVATLRHFVCLMIRNSWSICERRRREGLPALSVFWAQNTHKYFNLRRSLRMLTHLLTSTSNYPVVVLRENKKESSRGSTAIPTLETFLPATPEEVINLVGEPAELVQLPSLSPGLRHVKEVPPVFLIPGLQGTSSELLKPLAQRLMYPVLCARALHLESTLTDIASDLLKQMLAMQNYGSFNLVGVSCGGTIALEVAKLLEGHGRKTRVLLIDGAPETTQAAIKQLEKKGNTDENVVTSLLQASDVKMSFNGKQTYDLQHRHSVSEQTTAMNLSNKVTNESDWLKIMEEEKKDSESETESCISSVLTSLRSYLSMLLEYRPSGELMKGEICLIRPTGGSEDDNCGLDQFFRQTVNIHIVEGDHASIVTSLDTARIINEFVY